MQSNSKNNFKSVFPGVWKSGRRLYTKNLVPGSRVYGEKLVRARIDDSTELREWNPYRSKLAAAILNGLKVMPIRPGSHVLYLGAAQGTTPSHVSDIVGNRGYVVCVEISPKAMQKLLRVCEERENMVPILGDANEPEEYAEYLEDIDVVYQDVAQPNQVDIMLKNARYLKPGCYTMLCVKSRSIDVTKAPKDVFKESTHLLERAELETVQIIDLRPYDKDHAMIVSRKQNKRVKQ